jgi:uncharacterized protein YjdB
VKHARLPVVGLVVGALAASACGSATGERAAVRAVELSTATLTVVAGTDASVTARLLDAAGEEIAGRAVVWTTRDSTVAAVSTASATSGIVRGIAPGTTQIAANVEGRSAVATVTVSPRPVASVVVQPSALDLRVGGAAQLQVRTLDASGSPLTGRTVTYTSSDDRVAAVSSTGLVTAVAPGAATLTVASEGRAAAVGVTVTLVPVVSVSIAALAQPLYPGGTAQLTALAADSAGRAVTGRTTTWTSSDERVATVSSAGLVTAVSAGTTQIRATVEGRSATLAVSVLPSPVAAVALSIARASLTVGDTARVTARLTDAQGRPVAGRPVAFSTDVPNVVAVDSTGLVTALAPGAARVVATSDGVTGSVGVSVGAIPVVSVEVAPDTARLAVGAAVQLVATPRAASGAALAGRAVAWTSGAPGVAAVAADGRVTALARGTAIVFAQVEGVVGRAVIIVP